MLELKDLQITLSRTGRVLIDRFSFSLNKSDKAVLIGEEGNGKSTLLQCIHDKKGVEDYCDVKGGIIKKGLSAYLPQQMEKEYLSYTVTEYFQGAELFRYTDLLRDLGLSVDFLSSSQKVGTLSGGEKVKISLAKILMSRPDFLLLDEPTNDIDIETLEWLEDFIRRAKVPVLYISHDETLIERTANVIVHIEQLIKKTKSQITVSRTSYRQYRESRAELFDKQTQVAQKQRDEYEKQYRRWQQIYNKVGYQQKTISRQDPSGGRLLKKKMHSVLAQKTRFEREKEDFTEFPDREVAIITRFPPCNLPSDKIILDFSLPQLRAGERFLSENLQLLVRGGEHIGIVGRNGAGKTTLLSLLWEQLRCRKDIKTAYMPQDYTFLLDDEKSPVDFLSQYYSKQDVEQARTLMGNMKFTKEEMIRPIKTLSGGQKAKILFLDMVLKRADVLLLDEPTRNFSPLSAPVVREALISFGGCIISVSHDRKYLEEVCGKVYRLDENGLTAR